MRSRNSPRARTPAPHAERSRRLQGGEGRKHQALAGRESRPALTGAPRVLDVRVLVRHTLVAAPKVLPKGTPVHLRGAGRRSGAQRACRTHHGPPTTGLHVAAAPCRGAASNQGRPAGGACAGPSRTLPNPQARPHLFQAQPLAPVVLILHQRQQLLHLLLAPLLTVVHRQRRCAWRRLGAGGRWRVQRGHGTLGHGWLTAATPSYEVFAQQMAQ